MGKLSKVTKGLNGKQEVVAETTDAKIAVISFLATVQTHADDILKDMNIKELKSSNVDAWVKLELEEEYRLYVSVNSSLIGKD